MEAPAVFTGTSERPDHARSSQSTPPFRRRKSCDHLPSAFLAPTPAFPTPEPRFDTHVRSAAIPYFSQRHATGKPLSYRPWPTSARKDGKPRDKQIEMPGEHETRPRVPYHGTRFCLRRSVVKPSRIWLDTNKSWRGFGDRCHGPFRHATGQAGGGSTKCGSH